MNNSAVKFATAQDRVNNIMEKFNKDEIESLRKSETDEEYEERHQLLQEYLEFKEARKLWENEKKEVRENNASCAAGK